jgi:hypothetical protein
MKHIEANVIGGSEINIDSFHPYVQRLFDRHRNQVWEHSRFQLSSSQISFKSVRKPGGTLLGITGNSSGRIQSRFSDPYGRFCAFTLIGKLDQHETLISVYQVPRNSGATGNTTAHHQQVLQMKKNGIEDQNPWTQFCNALGSFLSSKLDAGHEIILGGDLNADLGSNMRGATWIIAKHNLVDVHRTSLGLDNEPATYSRGFLRLDFILITPDIASLVKTCGAEPFNYQFYSDHRGLYCDLRLSGLFDRNLSPLASPTFRDIRSGAPQKNRKYLSELNHQLVKHNVAARTEILKLTADPFEAEALDLLITAAMLKAKKTCAQQARHPVSPALHTAQTTHRILQFVLTQMRTNHDMTLQIERRQIQLTTPLPLPTSIRSATSNLKNACRDVQNLSRKATQLTAQHQSDKAAALAISNNINAEQALARLECTAATKEMFRRFPSSKPTPTGGISLILIPFSGPLLPNETRKGFTVTEPSDIEEKVLLRNRQHFSQAEPTDFAQPPPPPQSTL